MLEFEKRDVAVGRFAERAVGESSESAGVRVAPAPDPELVERPQAADVQRGVQAADSG